MCVIQLGRDGRQLSYRCRSRVGSAVDGPIGLFFARFCRYLQGCGIPVTKVVFPLRELAFRPMSVCLTARDGDGLLASVSASVD